MEQVLEKYELEVSSVTKGRGTFLAETSRGKLVLKEYKGSSQKAQALAKILEYLHQWEPMTETLILNKEGEYITKEEDGTSYILKTYIPGKECDTKNPQEILAAVQKMAKLHHVLLTDISVPGTKPQDVREEFHTWEKILRVPEHEMESELQRHNRELRCVKNYIQKKKQKNEFERLFAACYMEFEEQALNIEKEYTDFLKRFPKQQYGLCHGDCSQHNLVFQGKNPQLIHYEQIRYDMPISDLAKFMRKILEKNQWNVPLGLEMIDAYNSKRPLDYTEKMQLYYRLAYPEKFWKIANHYHNNRKVWVLGRDTDKLSRMKAQEKQRKQFLEILFYLGR